MIIVFCVLGIIWAFINYRLVKKIDVGLGVGGEHGAIVDLSSDQKELLIELGTKISDVSKSNISGCEGISQARILHLFDLCRHNVRRNLGFDCRRSLHCHCFLGRSHRFYYLRSHWHDDRHSGQLQNHFLCQRKSIRSLQNCL